MGERTGKALIVILAVLWAAGLAVALAQEERMALVVLLCVPAAVVGAWIVLEAMSSRPWAVSLVAFAAFFLLDATFRIRDYADKSLDAQVVAKLGTWALVVLVCALHLGRTAGLAARPSALLWFVLLGWLGVTATWSPAPTFGLVAVASMAVFLLFMLHLAALFDEDSIVRLLVTVCAVFCAISIVVYVVAPNFGRMYEWVGDVRIPRNRMRGISGTANAVGTIAGVGLLLAGLYGRRLGAPGLLAGAAAICALALLLSQSRTTMGVVAVILVAYHWGDLRRLPLLLIAGAAGALAFAAVLPWLEDLLALMSRSGHASEILTGTNRSAIWAAVLDLWSQRPIQGWGFGATLFILPTYPGLFGAAAHAHNGLLEVLVSSGLVGVGVLLAALAATTGAGIRARAWRPLAMLAFVLLRGSSEAVPFGGMASMIFVLFALSVALITRSSLVQSADPDRILIAPARRSGWIFSRSEH